MSPPGGMPATTSAPTPTVPPGESGTPLADFVAAARTLHTRGWAEGAAIAALETFRAQGVAGLSRRVARMNAKQDRTFREHFAREARSHRPNRRGDIITIRSAPHWPWRTSTAQGGGLS